MGKPKNKRNKSRPQSQPEWKIRCICGAREESSNDNEIWIQCDECENWQHNVCMGISTYSGEMPESYQCQDCSPGDHMELLEAMDRGERPWEARRAKEESKTSRECALPLTDECHHYTKRRDVGWDVQKYWDQRYSIFSRYDEGIYMTNDAWFGVTPEPVALQIATDLSKQVSSNKTILIDLFAGAGGNTIAFALSNRWDKIISIEKDPSTLACAQNNASIYGVSDRIEWVNDDCFNYISSQSSLLDKSKTVIFASPPWGGPAYSVEAIFDLDKMEPYSAKHIHQAVKDMDSALFLPRTSDLRQIAGFTQDGKKVDVVQYCMDGASKGMVAYIPAGTQ